LAAAAAAVVACPATVQMLPNSVRSSRRSVWPCSIWTRAAMPMGYWKTSSSRPDAAEEAEAAAAWSSRVGDEERLCSSDRPKEGEAAGGEEDAVEDWPPSCAPAPSAPAAAAAAAGECSFSSSTPAPSSAGAGFQLVWQQRTGTYAGMVSTMKPCSPAPTQQPPSPRPPPAMPMPMPECSPANDAEKGEDALPAGPQDSAGANGFGLMRRMQPLPASATSSS